MSLILDALKKAKDLAGRKAPTAAPTALASFRFGRPSRSEKIKRIALITGMALVIISSVGYTANFWVKRVRKQRAVLIRAPQPPIPVSTPAADVPAADATNQNPLAEDPVVQPAEHQTSQEPKPAIAAPASVPSVTPSQAVQARPRPAPEPPVATAKPAGLPAASPTPKPKTPERVAANPEPAEQPVAAASAADPEPSVPKDVAMPPPPAAPSAQPPVSPLQTPVPVSRGEIAQPSRDPFELALFYQKSGDYLRALEQYNKVLEKDPLNASVYNNLGLIHYSTNNTLEAIKAFRQATYIDPKYDKAHNNLGLALRQAGQDAEAQREFERALQLNPKNAEALTNLAALARKSGNLEQAKVQYLQAIQANPGNAEAHYNLAMLYEEQGETGNAIDHFKKFLALGSGSHPEVVADVERKIVELSKKK